MIQEFKSSGSIVVVLESCILYSAPMRDLLMWLATTNLFRPRWTDQIHEEWINKLLTNRSDLHKEQLEITRKNMNSHVMDCLVTNFEHIIDSLILPDPDDRLVLAAAIKSKANMIVTKNLRDFPEAVLRDYGIIPCHPDLFINHILQASPLASCKAIKKLRTSLTNPKLSAGELLGIYEQQGLPKTAKMLSDFKHLL